MKKRNKNITINISGITLIALVITIVVIIILAVIAIEMAMGNSGIFNRAREASKEYANAQEYEKGITDNYDFNLLSTRDGVGQVPAGTVISYIAGTTAPTGYLACDGTVYNIADYQILADAIKTGFGKYDYWGGDGTTTFAVPNLQGEFLRGYSSGGTSSKTSGVITSSVGEHQNGTTIPGVYVFHRSGTVSEFGTGAASTNTYNRPSDTDTETTSTAQYIKTNESYTGNSNYVIAYTSRPTNTSVLYCIKY